MKKKNAKVLALPLPALPQKLLLLLLGITLLALASGQARAVEVQKVVSPGGIEAWLVEDRSNPIISVEFLFDGAGGITDPAGKEGRAYLVSTLLNEGAGELDSQSFQGVMNDQSIGLGYSAGRDSFGGSLSTLTRYQDQAFDLLRLSLEAPRFDDEAVARMRREVLVGLARSEKDPNAIAGRNLRALLYGDHPYGRPTKGTKESLTGLSQQDLKDFVRDQLTQDRLYIGVSGDIDAESLGKRLDEVFGKLPKTATDTPIEAAEVYKDGGILVIERQQPQSIVVMAQPGIMRDDPDYYTALMVNYALGGSTFSSRLYEEVREKRGLAYGVASYLVPSDHAALIMARVGTQNARVKESLDIIKAEWGRLAQEGPTEEELADAKTYLTGSFALRLSSTGKIASILVAMQAQDLGIDYIDQRDSFFEKVTLEDVQRVARELFDPEQLTVVVIGQPEGITSTLDAPVK
ncbi:M16 family metallopeptidase [Rhodovibrionaceae bacterium A322]